MQDIGVRPLGNAKSALRLSSLSVIVSEGATMNGRRLVPRQRVVTLCNNFCKGGMPMLTIEGLITVLSFGLACFELGYTIGNKSQKNNRPRSSKTGAIILIKSVRD